MRIAIAGGGPGGLYLSILLEAPRPVARGRGPRAQRAGRHVRLRRRVLRRDAGRVRGRRSRSPTRRSRRRFVRWSEIDVHFRGADDHQRRARLLGAGAQGAAQHPAARARALGVDLRFRIGGDRARRRPRRRRRRRQQHAARGLRLRAVAGPRAARRTRGSAPTHVFESFTFIIAETPQRRRAGARVSVQRHALDVHRRDHGGVQLDKAACEALFGYG